MKRMMQVLGMTLVAVLSVGCSRNSGDNEVEGTQTPSAADNTRVNERDRNTERLTATDQNENEQDRNITQAIRKAIVADDALSTNAHNVKIIAKDGVVTLRGPVKTDAEVAKITAMAQQAPGVKRVDSQLEIQK